MTDPHEIPEDDDHALIGEYVLGLLPPLESQAVEARLQREPALRAVHEDWAARLTSLTAGPDVSPPARLRGEVAERLFPAPPARHWWQGWLGVLGLIAGPVAAFALALVLLQPPAFDPVLHAEMTAIEGSGAGNMHFAAGTDGEDLLIIRREGEPFPGRALQLWLIAGDAAPVSLGVLPDQERLVIPAPEGLAAGVILAVSDEPLGGSPTGQPTGAVLVAGPLYDI
ncbi:Anti-sigma-K factor RskA [Jannaschia faecimaris]|uniref:Regulator of SigK n=1 Tax=Jannaschia faecimaris TaxID=1244108 RepID=A0A1H3Q7K0_9RHOB|nr:anti-sigma factor [Jannaschia faecimaris]SDZ09357.1 Anti-sigma-K factor RskA [Jannaschia faecimaris]